jgi:hypothetical protein
MSNEISVSDEAVVKAALKSGKLRVEKFDGQDLWHVDIHDENNEEFACLRVKNSEALAAQAELDAANEVTDEMVTAAAKRKYIIDGGKSSDWGREPVSIQAIIRTEARSIIEAALKEKTK